MLLRLDDDYSVCGNAAVVEVKKAIFDGFGKGIRRLDIESQVNGRGDFVYVLATRTL